MLFKKKIQRIRLFISSHKYMFLVASVIIGLILILALSGDNQVKRDKITDAETCIDIIECNRALYATAGIKPKRSLRDDNDTQLLHAKANGLQCTYARNVDFEQDSLMLIERKELVRLRDNPFYRLKDMTHSYPYVIPEMASLLNDIGLMFRQKLREKNMNNFSLLVTSALRTDETQGHLSRRNRNAATQSTHLYGTTVDITYKDFFNTKTNSIEQNATAANALRETILDLREQCRLVVVRERRQACYHFTVVNCDPAKTPQDSISKRLLSY